MILTRLIRGVSVVSGRAVHDLDEVFKYLPQALAWLTTGGGGVMLWRAYKKWRDGRAQEQKEIEQAKLKEKLQGTLLYESEVRNRRRMQEYASQVRRVAFDLGAKEADLPPYPDLESVKDIYGESL